MLTLNFLRSDCCARSFSVSNPLARSFVDWLLSNLEAASQTT